MKNLEQWLRERPLAQPSENLDRRVDQVLAQAPAPRRNLLGQPIALWQGLAACLICALGGYIAHGHFAPPAKAPAPPAPTKIYVLQTDQLGTPTSFQIAPGRTVSVSGCIEAQVGVVEKPPVKDEAGSGSI